MEPIFRLPPDIEFQEVVTPLSEAMDWSIGFLGIDQVWKRTAGEGVLIIILDTGVDHTHPDLINQIIARKDFTRSVNGTMDSVGHGTHCAGIAAAEGNNNVGVISPAYKAKLACGKVLGAAGGREADLAAGINWACDLADEWPMAVLSTSWGGPTNSPLVEAALKRFTSKPKRISVAAAGNDGVNGRPGYPSILDYCVCVAAGNRNGTLTEFSSRSPRVDTVGPGEGIVSTMPGGRYAEMSGTCLAKGSYVYGPHGPRMIEHVQAGDIVFAFKDGKVVQRRVTANHYRGVNTVHRLRAAGRDVLATATHQMLTVNIRQREIEWVAVQDLTPDHRLLAPRELPTTVNPDLDAQLSEDFCWLMGFFLGDGWLSEMKGALRVNFAHKPDPEKMLKLQSIWEATAGKLLKHSTNGNWLYDDNTRMAAIVSALGLNHASVDKTVPMWVWGLPKHKRERFFDGYLDTDGHRNPKRQTLTPTLAMECRPGDLVRRLACLADYHGWQHTTVRSRTRVLQAPNSPAPTEATFHAVNIMRHKRVGGWSPFRTYRSKGGVKYEVGGDQVAAEMGLDVRGLFSASWKLEHDYDTVDVYDLTVPNADCFVTQGLITHNSMACPLVASVAACMLAADALDKDVDLADYKAFRAMLRATNKPMQDSGGYGLLNPPSLLEQVTDLDSPPAAEPRLVFDHAGVQVYKPARAGDQFSFTLNLEALLGAINDT